MILVAQQHQTMLFYSFFTKFVVAFSKKIKNATSFPRHFDYANTLFIALILKTKVIVEKEIVGLE